jgi:ribosomal protein S27AE
METRDTVYSLLKEVGEEPPIFFDNENNDLMQTSYNLLLPDSPLTSFFIKKLKEENIDSNPFVRSEREYDRHEIDEAKLFWVHVLKQRDEGYNFYGEVYTQCGICPKCGAGTIQNSNIILNCAKFNGIHFASTYNFEIIISSDLAHAISDFSGFTLLPIIDYKKGEQSAFFQFKPTEIFPILSPPTKIIKSSKYCDKCGLNGLFLDSEMHISSLPQKHVDAYYTKEWFGEMHERGCSGPELVLSSEIIKIIKKFDKKAFELEPIYFEGSVYR